MANQFTEVLKMFAYYGFTETPLKASEIDQMIAWGWDNNSIYEVGCDVMSGLSFREAIEGYDSDGIWKEGKDK